MRVVAIISRRTGAIIYFESPQPGPQASLIDTHRDNPGEENNDLMMDDGEPSK